MTRSCLCFMTLVTLAGGLTSCNSTKDEEGTTVALPLPPPVPIEVETLVGRVTILGADNTFVIFQTEAGETVSLGEELRVRFAGAPVGKIKVTPPEKKNRFYAADVLEGTMAKGYEVVRVRTEAPPAFTPAPGAQAP